MITSLVACGFLLQRVVPEDRRWRVLAFTELGKSTFGRAFGDIVVAGARTFGARSATSSRFRFGLRDKSIFEYLPDDGEPPPIYGGFDLASLEYEDSTPDLTTLDGENDGV